MLKIVRISIAGGRVPPAGRQIDPLQEGDRGMFGDSRRRDDDLFGDFDVDFDDFYEGELIEDDPMPRRGSSKRDREKSRDRDKRNSKKRRKRESYDDFGRDMED